VSLETPSVRQLASMLKRHAKIAHVDPLIAAGALHEVIGVALWRPVLRLPGDLAGRGGRQRCSSFLHARFFKVRRDRYSPRAKRPS
jgi:hypothetical protein